MRKFLRHPAGIPIEIHATAECDDPPVQDLRHVLNVSQGGIAFHFFHTLAIESIILIRIPAVRPVFESAARVIWCRPAASGYDVGAEFIHAQDEFRARMVEQVCQIESYRQRALREEHRELSADEAAREWIEKYAARFQQPDTDEMQ